MPRRIQANLGGDEYEFPIPADENAISTSAWIGWLGLLNTPKKIPGIPI
jgi:hypothetical protein